MKVLIARHSGFCDGVRRAMRMAMEAADRNGGLDADGPLVHNRQAVGLLELHGVSSGKSPGASDLPVLIRAHGAAPEKRAAWRREGRRVVDATCAHVANNQRLAETQAALGRRIVFAGDRDHAETRAVAGSAGGDCVIVSTPAEAAALPDGKPVFLLAQTTFEVESFREIARVVEKKFPDAKIADTICRSTRDRQREAGELAAKADALVVVGGRNSANTRRLAEAGRAAGKPVFLVETAAELRDDDFAGIRVAAVISGASTPGWITQDVMNRLRGMEGTPFFAQGARILQILVESRLSPALSGGGLALGAGFFSLRELSPALAAMGAAYVFFAHTLNRRVPKNPEARRLSLSDTFYRTRRHPLLVLAWLAAGFALVLACIEGLRIAAVYAALILATTLYALPPPLLPARLSAPRQSLPARNWPMAVGWALALGVPPALLGSGGLSSFSAILFVFCVCLGGTLVRDMHDIVSDKLMGIDTIPARTGVARSQRLASHSLGLACLLTFLTAGAAVLHGDGPSAWLGFVLLSPAVPSLGFVLLKLTIDRRLLDAVPIQAGVDGMGCLHGLLALAFGAWS